MKPEQKDKIKEKYRISLGKGERFWPDSIYKDLLVSLGIFILLILLATFAGVAGAPKADPALAEAGKTRFLTICAACHGPQGQGMIVVWEKA